MFAAEHEGLSSDPKSLHKSQAQPHVPVIPELARAGAESRRSKGLAGQAVLAKILNFSFK